MLPRMASCWAASSMMVLQYLCPRAVPKSRIPTSPSLIVGYPRTIRSNFALVKHELPYYAVIFTSIRTEGDNGYGAMSDRMEVLCRNQPGFLGMDHARSEMGITICYWKTMEDIANWKQNAEHLEAQKMGYQKWYSHYAIKICKVEKDYSWDKTQ
jgi:heme-degrading monooxygenase HmoA